jgi:hypothetical protein
MSTKLKILIFITVGLLVIIFLLMKTPTLAFTPAQLIFLQPLSPAQLNNLKYYSAEIQDTIVAYFIHIILAIIFFRWYFLGIFKEIKEGKDRKDRKD